MLDQPAYVYSKKPPQSVTKGKGGRKLSTELMFYAFLVKAREEGKLRWIATEFHITESYAEAMLRRYALFHGKFHRRVEMTVERIKNTPEAEAVMARLYASEYRFRFTA